MTETLFVLATAVAGFIFVDPVYNGFLTKATPGKVMLLALTFGSLLFHLAGRALTAPLALRRAVREVLVAWWPLIVLALWILLGSAYARFGNGLKENFLGMGLGMLFLPLVALAVRSSAHQLGLIKALGAIYVVTVLGMLAVLLFGGHSFHEEIFLAVPLGAYFLLARPLRVWQAVLGLVLIAGCVYTVKNTTFLLVLATLFGVGLVWVWRLQDRRSGLAVVVGLYWGIPAMLGAGAGLYVAWKRYRATLPSGNVEYRTEMYGIAWRHFLDSPIWGSSFVDSSVNYFSLYRVAMQTQNLPTHSDILDLLSHGGAVAIALWAATVWQMLRIGGDALRRLAQAGPADDMRAWRWLYVLSMVQLGAVITYAINPPLISPSHGFWTWGSAGVLWALHRVLTDADPAKPARARQPHRRMLPA